MFDQLHTKLEGLDGGGGGGVGSGGGGVVGGGGGGKFHALGQGLREEVERLSKENHRWESYNVDQLVCEGLSLCFASFALRFLSNDVIY